jgi:hypothetical protein
MCTDGDGKPPPRDGHGLNAVYYDGSAFERVAFERVDAMIDFDWTEARPDDRLVGDQFSVRWAAELLATQSERYTLYLTGRGTVRLLIDGKELINLFLEADDEGQATVTLEADQSVRLLLEYSSADAPAAIRLSWSSPTIEKQPIPTTALVPAALPALDQAAATASDADVSVVETANRQSCSFVADCAPGEVCATEIIHDVRLEDGRSVGTNSVETKDPMCMRRCDGPSVPYFSASGSYAGSDVGCPAGEICSLGACVAETIESATSRIVRRAEFPCQPDQEDACEKLDFSVAGKAIDIACSTSTRLCLLPNG